MAETANTIIEMKGTLPMALIGLPLFRNRSKHEKKKRRLARELPQKIREADLIVLSFPKSGRTWLKAMLTRLFQVRYDLPDGVMIKHDNLHQLDARIPKIFFNHDCNPYGPVSELPKSRAAYDGKKLVFLMRDPRDVMVSHYNQAKHRNKGRRENLSRGLNLFDYITRPDHGIYTEIEYTNLWIAYATHNPNALVLRYEDLKRDTSNYLKQMTDFAGLDFTVKEIEDAVSFGSLDNLSKLERSGYFQKKSGLSPPDSTDPGAYKVRRGKVHGYLEDLTPDQVRILDRIVETRMDPACGYLPSSVKVPK